MEFIRKIVFILIGLGSASIASASEGDSSVSPYAYKITEIFGLPITNSMIMSWVISLSLILLIRWAVGTKPKMIPGGGQIVVESLVTGIRGIIEPIVGNRMIKPTFPILIGFFTFILMHNWSGLLPGVGTIGLKEEGELGHFFYFFRPANADLNMTLALAIIHFAAWLYFIFKYAGAKAIFLDLFGNKAEKSEVPAVLYYILFFIFGVVGVIEIISIAFRPVSLSFRLFGNVFGGENLLISMSNIFAYILPIPFYFLEMLIGFVQALVFTLLVAVYIGLICNHGDDEHAHA